jgi:uncharacterized protein (UPF0303 family)
MERRLPITIDIMVNGQQLFHYACEGTSVDNDDWLQRKSNTVRRFFHSSLHMSVLLEMKGLKMQEKYLLPAHLYVSDGGSFPISIKGSGVIGSIGASGMQSKEDHDFIVEVLKEFLKAE